MTYKVTEESRVILCVSLQNESSHAYDLVIACVWTRHATQRDREEPLDMGWLRLVASSKIIGLLCRISSLLKGSFAKETYNFKEPTHRIHRIIRATWLVLSARSSLLHLECHSISISNLNFVGLFSVERGKKDLENYIISISNLKIFLFSFQRNVAKETQRTRSLIEIWESKHDTPFAIGCM